MTRDKLKAFITKRFGTQSQFCRLAGLNRTELQILFAVKKPNLKFLKRVEALATRVKPEPAFEAIPPQKLEALKRAINASGGVRAFCRENKGFSVQTVYQIIGGMYATMSPKVKALLKHFGI